MDRGEKFVKVVEINRETVFVANYALFMRSIVDMSHFQSTKILKFV